MCVINRGTCYNRYAPTQQIGFRFLRLRIIGTCPLWGEIEDCLANRMCLGQNAEFKCEFESGRCSCSFAIGSIISSKDLSRLRNPAIEQGRFVRPLPQRPNLSCRRHSMIAMDTATKPNDENRNRGNLHRQCNKHDRGLRQLSARPNATRLALYVRLR